MAKEILAIPEEHLLEVIAIIRAGLASVNGSNVSLDVRLNLVKWCDEEEEYMCSCPTLTGIKVVGSACPVHGFPKCEL